MAHTILLLQANAKPECRTYTDYESVNECMEGVCKIYEEHLKSTNPNLPSITYDISQLFEFIDQVVKGNVSSFVLMLTMKFFNSWPISPAWSTRSRPTPTLRTTRTGLKRRSTSCSGGRLGRLHNLPELLTHVTSLCVLF